VKRYVREDGSDLVRDAMARADGWYACRVGFVEVFRAVSLAAGRPAGRAFADEWPAFTVVEVDGSLAESAAALALEHDLRSLDALHLAAALVLPVPAMTFATWDQRLHAAARDRGLPVLPADLPG
jgi:hypothetical protein